MSEKHEVVITDEIVRGGPGTVARCSCGWVSAWGVQDGSAEADAARHLRLRKEFEAEIKARMGVKK